MNQVDLHEAATKFKVVLRDGMENFLADVDHAVQVANEAEAVKNDAEAATDKAKTELIAVKAEVAALIPQRDDLKQRVADLRKAIESVSAFKLPS